MNIQGLQKLSLLDYPGKVACTVFLSGCNLRCPFCHNASLVLPDDTPPVMDDDALLAFLDKRRGVLDGVCISGGEPLLHAGTDELIAAIKALGYAVKLDTNGSFPDRLRQLVEAGLVDYVAMDIKNAPARYAETVGREAFDLMPIKQSAAFLLGESVPYEFRTTVVRELHTVADFGAIGDWLRGASRYFLQGFVDTGDLLRSGLHACSREEMEVFRAVLLPSIPTTEIRGV